MHQLEKCNRHLMLTTEKAFDGKNEGDRQYELTREGWSDALWHLNYLFLFFKPS